MNSCNIHFIKVLDTSIKKPEKAKVQYYIAPLMDDATTPFMDVPPLILEKIFEKLSLFDLSRLSSTCKKFNDAIGEYLNHQCHSKNILKKLNEFFTSNESLLTIEENSIIPEIKKDLKTIQDNSNLSRKDIFLMLANVKLFEAYCRRISFAHQMWAPHKGNDAYIPVERAEDVKRDIVHVKDVCWLQFKGGFDDLDPGSYSVR